MMSRCSCATIVAYVSCYQEMQQDQCLLCHLTTLTPSLSRLWMHWCHHYSHRKSPEHSAEAKRQAFQEKAEAKHKEPKRVATPQMKPQEMTEKIPEKPDEFTQSDEARVYHALNFHVV